MYILTIFLASIILPGSFSDIFQFRDKFSPSVLKSSSPKEKGHHLWTSNGPYGGNISSMTFDDKYIYIGLMGNGIYRRLLEGTDSWEPIRGGLEYSTPYSLLATGPDSLFAGLECGGLWYTIDGGLEWIQDSSIPETLSVNVIFEYNTDTLLIGTGHSGLYRSFDGGLLWEKVGGPLGDTVKSTTFTRSSNDTNYIYLGTDRGVYKSSDFGNTWSEITIPDTVSSVTKLGWYSGFLYLGSMEGLYYRDIYGWQSTDFNGYVSDFVRLGDSIFVASYGNGIAVLPLNRSGYELRNSGLLYKMVNSIKVQNENLLAGTWGGCFFSVNNGETWDEMDEGLNANIIWDLKVNPITKKSVYAVSFGGLYKSMDNGESWLRYGTIPDVTPFSSISINPQDSSNILIGGYSGIYRTENNGETWDVISMGDTSVLDIEIDPLDSNRVYAAAEGAFLKSTNNGKSWTLTDSEKTYYDVEICKQASETLYIATDKGMFKSDDFGVSLYPINDGLPSGPFSKVEIDGYNPSLVYAGLKSSELTSLYFSTNGGRNWLPTNFPGGSVEGIKTTWGIPFHLFSSSVENEVFLSFNKGDEWLDISPATHSYSFSLDFSPILHTLYLGNLSGVYTYTDTLSPFLNISYPDSFSPDGDLVSDEMKFNIHTSDTNGIFYWNGSIFRDTNVIEDYEEFGAPDSIKWDGFNKNGILEKDGVYRAKLNVYDGFFNFDSLSKFFILSKEPMVSGVDKATATSQGRKIAVDESGRIHAVYTSFNPEEVFYVNSIDGINWSEPLDLSNSKVNSSLNPCIVINKDNMVFVFWEEHIADSSDIVYQRYEDGKWLNEPENLTNSPGLSKKPSSIETPDNNIHLVWEEKEDNQIYYLRYKISAGKWGDITRLTSTSGVSRDPFIIDFNGLYVFFSDNTYHINNFDIWWKHYNGNQWLQEEVLSSTPGNSFSPFAVRDSTNKMNLFWSNSTDGNFDIYYSLFRADSGWEADTNLTQTEKDSEKPTASIDSLNNISLFWQEGSEIFKLVKNNQSIWQSVVDLSGTPDVSSTNPSSSLRGDLIWTEGTSSPYKIKYSEYIAQVYDEIPPLFFIILADSCFIGDSLIVNLSSDELLEKTPDVWLSDNAGDSIKFTVIEEQINEYSAHALISGLSSGRGNLNISGSDMFGNTEDTTLNVWIKTKGNLMPEDSCFAFPNPTRKEYVKFMVYLNQSAHLKIEIFTLTGRRIKTLVNKDFNGGELHKLRMPVSDMGSDIYIFRAEASTGDEKKVIMKKFGVIR